MVILCLHNSFLETMNFILSHSFEVFLVVNVSFYICTILYEN